MRFKLSRLMGAMILVGVALHLGIVASQVARGRRPHVHSGVMLMGRTPGLAVATPVQPFWPAYWRRLLGLPGSCVIHGDFELEMCELANPEIRMPLRPDEYGAIYTGEQRALYSKLVEANRPPRKRDIWGEFVRAVNRKLESAEQIKKIRTHTNQRDRDESKGPGPFPEM